MLFTLHVSAGKLELSIADAECIALENNPEVQKLKTLYQKAREGKLEATSKWFPEVFLISSGYKTEKRDLYSGTHSVFLSQLTLSQPILSTERYFNLRISSLVVRELCFLYQAISIDTLYEVRTLYYKIILDRQNLETAKINVALFSDLAKQAESNYKRGTSILLNVNQAKVNIASAMTAYYEAEKELEIDLDRLTMTLGYTPGQMQLVLTENTIPVDSVPALQEKIALVPPIFDDFPDSMQNLFSRQEFSFWENTALFYRPTLAALATEVAIAGEEVGKKKGEYLPEVNLLVNYGGSPTNTIDYSSSNFMNQKFYWGVGYQVGWLLFDSFAREHRIKEAVYEKLAKKWEYERGVQQAFFEVRKEIFTIEASVSEFATAVAGVLLAEETVDLAKSGLDIGYITIFDYQIAVDSLIQARYTRDRARFDLIRGYFGLRLASGIDLARDLRCNSRCLTVSGFREIE